MMVRSWETSGPFGYGFGYLGIYRLTYPSAALAVVATWPGRSVSAVVVLGRCQVDVGLHL
jgi:hypothetical protein